MKPSPVRRLSERAGISVRQRKNTEKVSQTSGALPQAVMHYVGASTLILL